jgi:hypothetical protein
MTDTITKSIGGGIIGTIVPQNSRFGLTNGYKIIEVYEVIHDSGNEGKESG